MLRAFALILTSLLANAGVAVAQQSQASQFAPVPLQSNLFDRYVFEPRPFQPDYRIDKFEIGRFYKNSPQASLNDPLNLGDYKLRFDSSRTPVEFIPPSVTDAPDLAEVVTPARGGKKRAKKLQGYFGLTLTSPTE